MKKRVEELQKRFIRFIIVTLTLLFVAELSARFILGLGDPPLYLRDSEIGFLMKPGTYQRFGNEVSINQWSMRSAPIEQRKTSGEFRVVVFGDSVINGGSLTDQSELATELLQRELQNTRSATVCNISAGGWGPGNMLAYAKRFGLFDADVIVIVLSSHDVEAVVDSSLSVNHPEHAPMFALQELIARYAPRLFSSEDSPRRSATSSALDSISDLIELCKSSGARTIVVQHLTQTELRDMPEVGHVMIGDCARRHGVELVQLSVKFKASTQSPYRDEIHLNAVGQAVIADVLSNLIIGSESSQ